METGKILEKIIQNSGYSKTQFAKELDLSKSFMLRVINGEKKISESMVNKILSSKIISETDKQILSNNFFGKYFGQNNFNNMISMLNSLNSLSEKIKSKKSVYVREDMLNKTLYNIDTPYILGSCDEMYEIVSYFVNKLFASESPFFYSNYSFEQNDLDSILYTLFSHNDLRSTIDFIHIISHPDYLTKEEISSIFETIKWGTCKLNTYYSIEISSNNNSLFPYYIITNNCVLIFSFDCKHGLVFTQASTIDYYKNMFLSISDNYTPMCKFLSNQTSSLTPSSTVINNFSYSIGGHLCNGHALDKTILSEIAQDYLENKEYLIKLVLNFYDINNFSDNTTIFVSETAFTDFANTGALKFIGTEYVKNLPPDLRIRFIKNIQNHLRDFEKLKLKLINLEKLNIPSNLTIDIFDNVINFVYLFDNEETDKDYMYGFSIILNSAHFSRLFKDFYQYFTKNNFCYKDEYRDYLLDSVILKIKYSETD